MLASVFHYKDTAVLLSNTLINQSVNLVSISTEHIMLGATKVRVHLSRKEGVFRNIGPSRVFIEWEDQQPCDTNYNAQR
jgi:hypothetical protein